MKDVEAFVKTEKSPKSGLVKGYKFFCEGFIKDFEGKNFASSELKKQLIFFTSFDWSSTINVGHIL